MVAEDPRNNDGGDKDHGPQDNGGLQIPADLNICEHDSTFVSKPRPQAKPRLLNQLNLAGFTPITARIHTQAAAS